MNSSKTVASILLIVSFLPAAALAAGGTSSFEGSVKYKNGAPAKNVEIRVEQNGKSVARVRTDAQGHYATPAIPSGTYKVQLVISSIVRSTLPNAATKPAGATQLNFDLQNNQMRKVFIKEIGQQRGRWVEMDEEQARKYDERIRGDSAAKMSSQQSMTAGASH